MPTKKNTATDSEQERLVLTGTLAIVACINAFTPTAQKGALVYALVLVANTLHPDAKLPLPPTKDPQPCADLPVGARHNLLTLGFLADAWPQYRTAIACMIASGAVEIADQCAKPAGKRAAKGSR
jgi:hypothetical protein